MLFPEGLKTVRWDKDCNEVVEEHAELKAILRSRVINNKSQQQPASLAAQNRANLVQIVLFTPDKLVPLDLEEWREEHYNVMA